MTAGQILQYESSSFDKTSIIMDVKQLNGHASSTLTTQPNFAADGKFYNVFLNLTFLANWHYHTRMLCCLSILVNI
jgi:hypothetical protein